jgi:folate-dependent phosphoribosylglycinamide formyltransferase PurN
MKYRAYKLTFDISLKPSEHYIIPVGTMIHDGHTCTGMRVHVVKEDMDAPVIWNNAFIISESMLA